MFCGTLDPEKVQYQTKKMVSQPESRPFSTFHYNTFISDLILQTSHTFKFFERVTKVLNLKLGQLFSGRCNEQLADVRDWPYWPRGCCAAWTPCAARSFQPETASLGTSWPQTSLTCLCGTPCSLCNKAQLTSCFFSPSMFPLSQRQGAIEMSKLLLLLLCVSYLLSLLAVNVLLYCKFSSLSTPATVSVFMAAKYHLIYYHCYDNDGSGCNNWLILSSLPFLLHNYSSRDRRGEGRNLCFL